MRLRKHRSLPGYLCGCLLVFVGMIIPVGAQTTAANEWTWMGGSSTVADGVSGTLGTPAPGNIPGGRSDAATWTDSSGNFWLFGGSYYNDLWKFYPSTNEWAWMSGVGLSIQYGTLGTPGAGNQPGGRYGPASWTDSNGNLWLFGGYGFAANDSTGALNDLWEFSPSTNEWTWMGGSSSVGDSCFPSTNDIGPSCAQPGVYGTLGMPAAGDIPGGRVDATSWTDAGGNFWLFGGWGFDVSNQVQFYYNDLWEFGPSTNEWTWMGGSSTGAGSACMNNANVTYLICGEPGTYGTLRTPAAENNPGGRAEAANWIDSSGNFWLFGGNDFDADGDFGYANDLWKFSPASSKWTWMGGSDTVGSFYGFSPAVWGALGTPAAANIPGGRYYPTSWEDHNGNFWLFGGIGGPDDLWVFNPSTNEWAWMDGNFMRGNQSLSVEEDIQGVYGSLRVPAPGNTPGVRSSGSGWTDSNGNLWLFGGYGYDTGILALQILNDVWEYQPSNGPLPTAATPTFSVASGTYAAPQTISINDATNGALIFYTLDGTTPTAASSLYCPSCTPVTIPYSATLNAIAIASGCFNSAVASANYTLPAQVATPTFSVPAGTYTTAQSVTISDVTPGIAIYYTTDGSIPTASSGGSAPSTSGLAGMSTPPITVSNTETINAIAVANGYNSSSAGASALASATYTINLLPPGFAVGGTGVTVAPGATTGNTSTITLTPSGGFTGAISLSCTIAPTAASDRATCSIPAAITISGSTAQTTTLTVNTTAATSALSPARRLFWPSAGGAALACILLVGIPARRRRWQGILGMLVLLFSITCGVVACGGGGNGSGGGGSGGNSGTTAGTYTITVTGISGAITQTGTVSLTVQ